MFRKTLAATALLSATAFSIASAAPLAPQATFSADGGLVTQAKTKNGPVVVFPPKPPIKVPTKPPIIVFPPKPPKPLPPPPKTGGKNRPVIVGGGVTVLGGGDSCDASAARCARLYGTRTSSYRRCLRRAGC